jgi:hypothetical protein
LPEESVAVTDSVTVDPTTTVGAVGETTSITDALTVIVALVVGQLGPLAEIVTVPRVVPAGAYHSVVVVLLTPDNATRDEPAAPQDAAALSVHDQLTPISDCTMDVLFAPARVSLTAESTPAPT